jgi:hypothetical protein
MIFPLISLRYTPGPAGALIKFDNSGMPGSGPGGKGIARRKHRLGEPFSRALRSTSAEGGGPLGDPPDRPYWILSFILSDK